MTEIDLSKLQTLLDSHRELVEEALKVIHQGEDMVMSLLMIELGNRAVAQPKPLHEAISRYLADCELTMSFVNSLRRVGHDISAANGDEDRFSNIDTSSFNPQDLGEFTVKASNYRCRVFVDDVVQGSGTLISHRLVLTAWHVVNQKGGWADGDSPKVSVLISSKRNLKAQIIDPQSPCHDEEWDGVVSDLTRLNDFHDYALLRLFEPVGFSLGFLSLPDKWPVWQNSLTSLLLHYPEGQDLGFTFGTTKFGGATAARFEHNIPTRSGSSGGMLFSNKLAPIGMHQGKVGNKKRLVPLARFANDNLFRETLNNDRYPTYLWSLDRSLESHIIIGKQKFFDTLDSMIDRPSNLRGIWMRRLDPTISEDGLGFPYRLLKAFLALRDPLAKLFRIELPLGEEDLFDKIELAMRSGQTDNQAREGVLADQTTFVAHEGDRAAALIEKMENNTNEKIWLYIDGPQSDLSQKVQFQLEQFIAKLAFSTQISFVLTRLESYSLPLPSVQSLAEAESITRPIILNDYVGDFARNDVTESIRLANAELMLGLKDDVVEDIATRSLIDVQSEFGRYPSSAFRIVSERISAALKIRMDAA